MLIKSNLFFLVIIFVIAAVACQKNNCPDTKTALINQFNQFVNTTLRTKQYYSIKEWETKDKEFTEYLQVCYPPLDTGMYLDERQKFWSDALRYYFKCTEVYGKYFFYLNSVFLFQFINDPGIQNWNAQYVPKNRSNTPEHLVSLMQIKFLLFLVFCLAAIGFAWMAGYADLKMTLFICVNLALTSLFMILRGAIAGLGYYRADSFFSALDKVFMILILGYLSWLSPWRKNFDIMLLVYGQGLSFLLACTAATIFLIRKTGFVYRSYSFRHMATVLRQSAPYVLILLFMTACNKLDGVMLGAMLDDNKYQAGVYAAAYRFYDAANMTGYLFAALLLPMYASNLGNLPVLNELKATGLKLTSAIASGIGCITIFYGEPLLKAVYDEYTPDFYLTLRLLMVGNT